MLFIEPCIGTPRAHELNGYPNHSHHTPFMNYILYLWSSLIAIGRCCDFVWVPVACQVLAEVTTLQALQEIKYNRWVGDWYGRKVPLSVKFVSTAGPSNPDCQRMTEYMLSRPDFFDFLGVGTLDSHSLGYYEDTQPTTLCAMACRWSSDTCPRLQVTPGTKRWQTRRYFKTATCHHQVIYCCILYMVYFHMGLSSPH